MPHELRRSDCRVPLGLLTCIGFRPFASCLFTFATPRLPRIPLHWPSDPGLSL